MRIEVLVAASGLLTAAALPAHAALAISNKATHNVACANGTCTATAKGANLNVGDLQTMLASGDVSVVAARNAKDIVVRSAFGWASAHALALDAQNGIAINASISVQGAGGLTLTGTLTLGPKASIDFLDTSSALVVNGQAQTLVADLATLGADVIGNPTGHYALARDYNAGPDGVYPQDPVSPFPGSFNGLGHTVKNLRIANSDRGVHVGMFYEVGAVSHFHLANAHVRSKGTNVTLGILAGGCGPVEDVSVSGTISSAPASYIGGVCGVLTNDMDNVRSSASVTGNGGTRQALGALGGVVGFLDGGAISNTSASGNITGGKGWVAGGLVGYTQASTYTVTRSYATGVVIVGDNGVSGGLMGSNAGGGAVSDCYATGFVGGGVGSTVGGLIGINNGPVGDSYSSGAVTSGSGNAVGGLVGNDWEANDLTDTYWDITTSGQSHGVGNDTAYPGVTGLTTEQFQAGLPEGLDPAIWAEAPDINGGLPYLLSNPPG